MRGPVSVKYVFLFFISCKDVFFLLFLPVSTLLSFHLKEFFSFVSFLFFLLCIDDHGSFVICRAASVRPKHLSDQNFDHDYYFKLPFQGAGCPIKWTTLYFTPCTSTSFPAFEPNQPGVAADLLAARKPLRSPNDQNVDQPRDGSHARMRHQQQHLGPFLGFLLDRCR